MPASVFATHAGEGPQLYSLSAGHKKIEPLLEIQSSAAAKLHPEYGILPFNAQCSECVELIDKRSLSSRLFIDPKNAGHTYSQQSYFPLHYKKSEDDIWRTIDHRLRPDATQPGVYTAVNQPVVTKCDLNKKTVSLNTGELEFEFNKNLTMYFFDENTAYTQKYTGDYSLNTIGEEGLLVKNIWPGIDLQQVFRAGEIETNYVINKPLQLPISKGWMVIEDHFTLPEGFTFEEAPNSEHVQNGGDIYYKGNYILKNAKGDSVIIYEKPVYVDAKAWGMHGNYKLLRTGNDYTLQMFVPVSWLSKPDNNYPLYIDPIVFGNTKLGNFSSQGISASLAFTSMQLGSCDYHITVVVPGESQLTNTYVDLEYQLTYDNTCGSPPEPAPYCTFSQVTQQVVCDSCHTNSDILSCHPETPPYGSTCTTDSTRVPGAHSIQINNTVPGFISCYPVQCANYLIPFTLKNTDSICGDACGFLCARGNMWQMTVEAYALPDFDTAYASINVCTGDPVTLTAPVGPVVPPYYCVWTLQSYGQNVFTDTTYNTDSITFNPSQYGYITCGLYSSLYNDTAHCIFSADVTTSQTPTSYYLSRINNTLLSRSTTGNQWYRNDTLIPGATSERYTVTQPGSYSVKTFDGSGCETSYSFPMSIDCVAYFYIVPDPNDSTTYWGYNESTQPGLSYLWTFGDNVNDSSTLEFPSHTYAQPGDYTVCLTVSDTSLNCSSTFCDSATLLRSVNSNMVHLIFMQQTTGLPELGTGPLVNIYPNPASTELNIQTNNFQPQWLTVYDLNGRKVTGQKFVQKLDISKLSAGSYFIEIKGAGTSITKKFVKLTE